MQCWAELADHQILHSLMSENLANASLLGKCEQMAMLADGAVQRCGQSIQKLPASGLGSLAGSPQGAVGR